MKEGLSSIDIGILAREFDQELKSGRIERIYQISERELKIRVYVRNKGSLDLIITPRYVCITKYERKAPRVASSFAMQLRKYLNGAFIKSVSQHKFDRIIEFELEKKDTRFFLVAELFSRGNVILCDSNRRIIGLLEWQKWSDRKLGVSNEYKYPPEVLNPLEIEFDKFKRILKNSERSIVATLARDLGLGGIFAEEICINSGVDKSIPSIDISEEDASKIFNSIMEMAKKIRGGEIEPMLVFDKDKNPVDVIPFDMKIYEKFYKKGFETLNDAVDEYFSAMEISKSRKKGEELYENEIKRLKRILAIQEDTLKELNEKYRKYKNSGDLIYQNIDAIDAILNKIGRRYKGDNLNDLRREFIGKRIGNIDIKEINRDGTIIINIGE